MVVNKDSHHGHSVNLSLCTDRTGGGAMLVSRGEKAAIITFFTMTENKIRPLGHLAKFYPDWNAAMHRTQLTDRHCFIDWI